MAFSPWRQNALSRFRSILPLWPFQYTSISGSTTWSRLGPVGAADGVAVPEVEVDGAPEPPRSVAGAGAGGASDGVDEPASSGLYDRNRRSPWLRGQTDYQGLPHLKPMSDTLRPLSASRPTFSAAAPGWLLSVTVERSGWGSPLGIVSRILAVRSSPDVVGSTVILAVPAGERMRRSCGSQLGHAELSSTRLTMVRDGVESYSAGGASEDIVERVSRDCLFTSLII